MSAPTPWVTRFAPSPTGFLHLGHVYAAWMAWWRARTANGRFMLRIEDIDPERCRLEYTAAIIQDLRWLGLDWDNDVLMQSEHMPLYRAALDGLAARGLIYPCFCSRAEIRASASAPHGPDGAPVYPGLCRRISQQERATRLQAGAPHAWRLDMARAVQDAPPLYLFDETGGETLARPEPFGDIVLARRDVPASYHLCATHDDAAQGVTLVTRGDDLLPATHVQRLLQHLMKWPVPRYAHHRLITDGAGQRLSKREGNGQIHALRQAGVSVAEVWRLAEVSSEDLLSAGMVI